MATITYGEAAAVDRAGRIEETGVAHIPEAERDSRPAEVVEVLPDRIGSRDITALVAERVVRETLTGVALARVRPPAMSGNAP